MATEQCTTSNTYQTFTQDININNYSNQYFNPDDKIELWYHGYLGTSTAIPSNTIRANDHNIEAPNQFSTSNSSYTLAGSFQPPENISGTFRFTFDLHGSGNLWSYGRIKKNGVWLSSEYRTYSYSYQTESEDITTTLNITDTLELYIYGSLGTSAYARNFRLKYDYVTQSADVYVQNFQLKYITS